MCPIPIFPPEFVQRARSQLGDELEPFLSALANPPGGLRVNTLRLSATEFGDRAPFALDPLAFPEEGFLVGEGISPGRHPYHAAGVYYLQDPSAMVVGALVDPQPGEAVLDLAAAPGGKATHLAARMRNTGLLVANDINRARAGELTNNLERCGVRNAIVTVEPVERLTAHFGAIFDRVLVDAPCSGESMFHKSAAALADWSIAGILGNARRQSHLLEAASNLVKPGGLLVYSTCTFGREENEEVVEGFLERCPGFEPAEMRVVPGAVYQGGAGGRASGGNGSSLRLWPHRFPGAGHFVASFTAEGDRWTAPEDGKAPQETVGLHSRKLLDEFMSAVYPGVDVEGRLVERGERVFAVPESAPSLAGLSMTRPGLWLGSARAGRFEPAHALVMALPPESAHDSVTLTADDPRVPRYLSGETIPSAGRPGWVPVTVDGFAVGWGKRVGETVKNHYPKGLRVAISRGS